MPSLTRTPACRVKGCPAPRDPDWHVPICGHGLEGHHHHVTKRSQGGKDGPQVFICPDCHHNIDNGEWGNAAKNIPGRGLVYWAWDLHGNTLIEKDLDSVLSDAAARSAGNPDTRQSNTTSAASPSAEQSKEESDGANAKLGAGEVAGISTESTAGASTLLGTAAAPGLCGRDEDEAGDSLARIRALTHEQRVADWCRRGMGFVYNGERLDALTDEWRFQVGEWLNEGEGIMPEEVHGYLRGFRSPMALRQYAWVAGVVTRVTGLSWTHHRAVAALPAPERQEKLEKALVEGLSTRAMMGPPEPRERHACPDCGADHQVKA